MSLKLLLHTLVGISLFILGMLMIKYSLKENYGDKLQKYLLKFTRNRVSGVLTGAAVTFCMQSSSASSVLTAAFVDSGYLDLYRAFWIIAGANAGTAFTGLITAMDVSAVAPVFCVAGVVMISFCRKKKLTGAGIVLTGLGLLFVGMNFMTEASQEISGLPFLQKGLIMCSSPVTGVLAGAFITALVQSSSAVTAILQSLAGSGIIGIEQAYYIILGSNIGTCATCAVSCAGLSKGAKYVSYMHILYNAAGALLFFVLGEIFPVSCFSEYISSDNIKTAVAGINIIFNVVSALAALMLPVRSFTGEKRKQYTKQKGKSTAV